MEETVWKGKFFESDPISAEGGFEPDHVVTVSELISTLPSLPANEENDYRMLLAEIKKPYTPPVEKKLSPGLKALLLILAIAASIAGGLLIAFFTSFVAGTRYRLATCLPEAVCAMVFLFTSFAYFCTKGKTEKVLMVIFLISGLLTVGGFFISI